MLTIVDKRKDNCTICSNQMEHGSFAVIVEGDHAGTLVYRPGECADTKLVGFIENSEGNPTWCPDPLFTVIPVNVTITIED